MTWNRFKSLSQYVPELGLWVDASKTSLADDAVTSDPLVATAFPAAFESMARLESGGVANPDEGRRVGHYWLRAPQLAPDEATRRAIEEALAAVKRFAEDVYAG